MGGFAGVIAQAGSSMASGASAAAAGAANVGKSFVSGAYGAGKDMLANAWKEASGGITMNDNMGDVAYKTGKALMSQEYSKSQPVQLQMQEAQAPQMQAPDAKEELERLMSNMS